MKIPEPSIRFLPFSHEPGMHCMLPGSTLSCQIFPSKICVYDQQKQKPQLVAEYLFLDLGPLEEFTVTQNLEKGGIFVSGFTFNQYLQYQVVPAREEKKIALSFIKVPKPLTLLYSENSVTTSIKIEKGIPREKYVFTKPQERLFLGNTKAQKWPYVWFRQDLREILPHVYAISQTIPGKQFETKIEDLKEFLLTAFCDMLIPQLSDTKFLGYPTRVFPEDIVPVDILHSSFYAIRRLFFKEEGANFFLLPALLPLFCSGMLSKVKTEAGHLVSIEWTRSSPRRVWIEAKSDDGIYCLLPKQSKTFRFGSKRLVSGSLLELKKDRIYLLDRFEK
jgi:hypothetical protein